LNAERAALCPECGEPLSISVELDEETNEIKIVFFCEGAGDDVFAFEILTGLTNDDLCELTEEGKVIEKKMKIKLLKREPEPSEDDEFEED